MKLENIAQARPCFFEVFLKNIEGSNFLVENFSCDVNSSFSEYIGEIGNISLTYIATEDGMPDFKSVDEIEVRFYKSNGDLIETKTYQVKHTITSYALSWSDIDTHLTYEVGYNIQSLKD